MSGNSERPKSEEELQLQRFKRVMEGATINYIFIGPAGHYHYPSQFSTGPPTAGRTYYNTTTSVARALLEEFLNEWEQRETEKREDNL